MIMVTTEQIAGKRIIKTLGLVRGIARADCDEPAFQKITEQAEKMGANAIVGVRLRTWGDTEDYLGDFEVYGTAVVAE